MLAVAVTVGCGGDTVQTFDDDDGGGGSPPTTTTTGGFGGTPTTTSQSGGSGGVGNAGGAGGTGGDLSWSEPPLHLEEQCLGEVPVGTFSTFEIPANTFGLTVVGKAATDDTAVGVERLRPGGLGSVIANFDIPGKDIDAFVGQGIVAGASPQSDSADALPMHIGEWRVRFGDAGAGTPVDVCVYARRTADGVFHGGVMDVNVRIAPGAGVSSDYVQGVLNGLFNNYFGPSLGIIAGTITFGSLSSDYDAVSSITELHSMFRSSVGIGPRPAVNLFVVGDFTGGDFGNAIGVAGGIPGSAVVHGTSQSGVAYQPSGDTNFDAAVLAHELGHLGGLFHTTEIQVASTDPLSDTPECANIGNDPNSCPDVGNIMFPIAYSGTQFSPSQVTVMQASALYRGNPAAGASPGGSLPGTAFAFIDDDASALTQTLQIATRRAAQDDVERLLSSIWCAHGGVDHLALVHARTSRARLMELVRDSGAFDLTRSRALETLARFADDEVQRAAVASLARELVGAPSAGQATRRAAVRVIEAATPP